MLSGWRVLAAAGLTLVVAGAGVAGCSGRTDRSATSSATSNASAAQAAGRASGGAANQAAPLAAGVERQVISTATLRIEVADVGGATTRAGQLAVEAGGFVAGSEESGASDERRARVTLKVPGDRFDRLVVSIAGLGDVQSKQVSTEDVTEQVVDLDARLRAARAGADRLQQLIARAATVTEVVGVEAELARRTAEIESLEGRLRVLSDKVDLATVTLALSPPQTPADGELPGFLSGFRGGWRALRATAVLGSAAIGALLPWLVPLALLGFASRLSWRRWRRAHPSPSRYVPPAVWPPGPPPGAGAPTPAAAGPPPEPTPKPPASDPTG